MRFSSTSITMVLSIKGISFSLQAEVEAAEDLLNNAEATVKDARELITSLNTAITAAGGTAVTDATLIEYVIPVGIERYVIRYDTNTTHTAVSVATGAHGEDEVAAVILTDKGVLITATKDAFVYYACPGAKISGTTTVKVDGTAVLKAELLPNKTNNEVEEEIDYVRWTYSSGSLSVESPNNGTSGTIKGLAAGTAKVTAYVTTVQGNTYTAEIMITVTE